MVKQFVFIHIQVSLRQDLCVRKLEKSKIIRIVFKQKTKQLKQS